MFVPKGPINTNPVLVQIRAWHRTGVYRSFPGTAMAKFGSHCYRVIMCMRPANERRRYIVTSSLIGWVHTQNDPCHTYGGSALEALIWKFTRGIECKRVRDILNGAIIFHVIGSRLLIQLALGRSTVII